MPVASAILFPPPFYHTSTALQYFACGKPSPTNVQCAFPQYPRTIAFRFTDYTISYSACSPHGNRRHVLRVVRSHLCLVSYFLKRFTSYLYLIAYHQCTDINIYTIYRDTHTCVNTIIKPDFMGMQHAMLQVALMLYPLSRLTHLNNTAYMLRYGNLLGAHHAAFVLICTYIYAVFLLLPCI